jgi:hypothetical protein
MVDGILFMGGQSTVHQKIEHIHTELNNPHIQKNMNNNNDPFF